MEGWRDFLDEAIDSKRKGRLQSCQDASSGGSLLRTVVWTCNHSSHVSLKAEKPVCEVKEDGIFLCWLSENIYGIPVEITMSASAKRGGLVFPSGESEYVFPTREIWPRCSTYLNYEMDSVETTKFAPQTGQRRVDRERFVVTSEERPTPASMFVWEGPPPFTIEVYLPG